MNLWVIFLTGLTVGGVTCLAVQGGLLASVIAAKEQDEIQDGKSKKNTVMPIVAFLIAKLAAHVLLGFLLGLFGEVISIGPNVQTLMQFLAGVYMIFVALDLFNVHPIFRYVIIQPPRFLTRMIRNQSRSKELFAPLLLGAMTVFIPCGTTLAMEALAISSANPLMGALTMGLFVLGTFPLFFGIGWITSLLGDNFRSKFLKLAAVAILYLGISSVNGAMVASGSNMTLGNLVQNLPIEFVSDDASGGQNNQNNGPLTSQLKDGYQEAVLDIGVDGYNPEVIRIQKDTPTKLTLKTGDYLSCAAAFRIPSLKIGVNMRHNQTKVVDLPALAAGTSVPFTCSMGMYRGVIQVI